MEFELKEGRKRKGESAQVTCLGPMGSAQLGNGDLQVRQY